MAGLMLAMGISWFPQPKEFREARSSWRCLGLACSTKLYAAPESKRRLITTGWDAGAADQVAFSGPVVQIIVGTCGAAGRAARTGGELPGGEQCHAADDPGRQRHAQPAARCG